MDFIAVDPNGEAVVVKTRRGWISDSPQKLLGTSQSFRSYSSFCPRGISFPLSRDPSLGKGQKEDFLRREREGGRMWSGGTLLRLPIAVKSTDINIHSLSIPHPRLILAGTNSSNSGILAPFSLSFLGRFSAPEKIESIRHPPPCAWVLSASDDDF